MFERVCSRVLLAVLLCADCKPVRPRLRASVLRIQQQKSRLNTRPFLAREEDFFQFTRWHHFELGDIMIGGHPAGVRRVFLNRPPLRRNEREFPRGTMIVHAVERGHTPSRWELFAMVKRGGNYNHDGARGWEYFILSSDDEGRVAILSRGIRPTTGHESAYATTDVGPRGCNACHGTEDTRDTDSLLSDPLRRER